jgi:hypothetical protein
MQVIGPAMANAMYERLIDCWEMLVFLDRVDRSPRFVKSCISRSADPISGDQEEFRGFHFLHDTFSPSSRIIKNFPAQGDAD